MSIKGLWLPKEVNEIWGAWLEASSTYNPALSWLADWATDVVPSSPSPQARSMGRKINKLPLDFPESDTKGKWKSERSLPGTDRHISGHRPLPYTLPHIYTMIHHTLLHQILLHLILWKKVEKGNRNWNMSNFEDCSLLLSGSFTISVSSHSSAPLHHMRSCPAVPKSHCTPPLPGMPENKPQCV